MGWTAEDMLYGLVGYWFNESGGGGGIEEPRTYLYHTGLQFYVTESFVLRCAKNKKPEHLLR